MRKIPKKPKGKGKRWAKGHSCSSNPESKKFREAAKSRFFRHEVGEEKISFFIQTLNLKNFIFGN